LQSLISPKEISEYSELDMSDRIKWPSHRDTKPLSQRRCEYFRPNVSRSAKGLCANWTHRYFSGKSTHASRISSSSLTIIQAWNEKCIAHNKYYHPGLIAFEIKHCMPDLFKIFSDAMLVALFFSVIQWYRYYHVRVFTKYVHTSKYRYVPTIEPFLRLIYQISCPYHYHRIQWPFFSKAYVTSTFMLILDLLQDLLQRILA
jgi:hypothetical protein